MNKAYIVAVDMGYGHKRAAFPLRHIAVTPSGWHAPSEKESHIICANTYPGIPASDRKTWNQTQSGYEFISRFKDVPVFGEVVFGIMDYFQNIFPLYPLHDATKPTFQLKSIYNLIAKGWGKHLIEELNKDPLPLLCTFFTPAFFAEEHGYKGEIYLLCTDTDVSRAWVALRPDASRIKYFAPTERVAARLKSYGVKPENIFLTGFPLPQELIPGVGRIEVIKQHTLRRIAKLDPAGVYANTLLPMLDGKSTMEIASDLEPISLAFAVGGAGAQQNIGFDALTSLAPQIRSGKFSFTLIAGVNKEMYDKFNDLVRELGLNDMRGKGIDVVFDADKDVYLKKFIDLLPSLDLLWTKPSELSFYSQIGLPIIIAPHVGAQERCNIEWLYRAGAGVQQEEPTATAQWMEERLSSGIFARMACNGYLAPLKYGTDLIEQKLFENYSGTVLPCIEEETNTKQN